MIRSCTFYLLFLILPALAEEEKLDTPAQGEGGFTALAEKFLGENGGDRFFYYPTKTAPDLPSTYKQPFEDITFASEDGTKLHGWFLTLPEGEKPKGTIVFNHGNSGSVGYHLHFVLWMVKAGYQVLVYDYRGFGKSEGIITRKGIVEDVRGAINYVKTRKDVDPQRLISFGHSLGGAKSLAALGQKMIPGVRGVISFAGFASYQDMARRFAGETGVKLVNDDLSARDLIEKISPVPVLIVHGTKDLVVPFSQGEKLFEKAKEPKTFYKVPEGSHTRALFMNDEEYRKKVLVWMAKVLS